MLALIVALRTYIRQGSRIRASYIVQGYNPTAPLGKKAARATVRVFVRNLGQAPIEISGIYFDVLGNVGGFPEPPLSLMTGEPKFPYILVGGTAVVWEVHHIPLEMEKSIGPYPYKLRHRKKIYVLLATGRRVRVKWATSTPPQPWMFS